MRERGILFNDAMVRAILEGRKTQTRRIMKVQPESAQYGLAKVTSSTMKGDVGKYQWAESNATGLKARSGLFRCPFGEVGDRLYVRETFAVLGNEDGAPVDWNDNVVKGDEADAARIYRASCEKRPGDYGLWSIPDDAFWKPHTKELKYEGSWRPSLHMPRWASRITLEITDVRVERLKDITNQDAMAEGVGHLYGYAEYPLTPKDATRRFAELWESQYGEGSWDKNPWVWCISFKRVEAD